MTAPARPFRPLPWAVQFGDTDETLPPDDTGSGDDGTLCRARAEAGYRCTMPIGHESFHRAGTGYRVVAEWVRDDPKPPAALVAEFPSELPR